MNKKIFYCILFGILLFAVFSCDILRTSPFEVVSWTPGEGHFTEIEEIAISLGFSHDPDKLSVEKVFSVTADGNTVHGELIWDGKIVSFKTFAPLEANREYSVTILSDAHDTKGLSMDDNFEAVFYTRAEGKRPKVISVNPRDDRVILNQRMPIEITFTEKVNAITCRNFINISPSMPGSWDVNSDGVKAIFTPQENWVMGTLYYLTVPPDFSSAIGITAGKEFKSRFQVGNDKTPPELMAAYAIDSSCSVIFPLASDISGGVENPNWESSYSIKLDFSEPVNTDSVKNYLSIVGAGNVEMKSLPGFTDSLIFSFTEKPLYLKRFDIKIGAGIEDKAGNKSTQNYLYRIFTNGVYSKPPELIGIRFPLAPGESNPDNWDPVIYSVNDLFADFPIEDGSTKYIFDTAISTWMELYFDTAPGSALDLFSIMNLFGFSSTNNALSFSFRLVKDSGFSWIAPHDEWASFSRIEIQGRLTNRGTSGVVSIGLGDGVLDTYGNKSEKDMKLILLK